MLHSGTHDSLVQSVLNYRCLPFILFLPHIPSVHCHETSNFENYTMHKQTLPFQFLSVEYFEMYFLRNKFLLVAISEIYIENFIC
jgi:hypothetical protein